MSLPYIIYYISPNENFGRQWTLEEIPLMTEDAYGWLSGDYMTRGRYMPPYEEFAQRSRQVELESNIKDSKNELTIRKMCVTPETLDEELRKMDPTTVTRFIDPALQLKYLELHK